VSARRTSRSRAAQRVLVVEQGGRGGVADYTAALTAALAADGAQVTLATADDHLYPPADGVEVVTPFRYVRGHSPLGRLVRCLRLGRIANGLLFLAAVPRLALLARRAGLVHTQGWEDLRLGVLAVAAMRLVGALVVQTEHNTFERGASRERSRWLLAALTARTIVHARADLPRCYAHRRGAAVVIPHGEYGSLARRGGEGDRAATRARLGVPQEAPAVLLFGQLRADKGLGDLLSAAREVDGLHVVIAGEDTGGLAEVKDLLEDPALAGRVHLREGFVPIEEAADLFAAADAAVLPYPRASQSGVLLLAYGFSRPVVAYPVGGLAEAVEDGRTGWLCARPDVPALVEALRAVVAAGADECARRGAEARRLSDERYAWDVIARRTRAVHRDAGLAPRGAEGLATARVVFHDALADGRVAPDALVGAARRLRPRRVPPAPVRLAQLVRRRRGAYAFDRAVAAPLDALRRSLLADRAAGPPRVLVRVDEFPHYLAADEPDRYGTEAFKRFRAILGEAGVPWLAAVPSRVSARPLDPTCTDWRPLRDEEIDMLHSLVGEGVTLALHGRDHRTRHASPRRHSELSGLSPEATVELIESALTELAEAGLPRPAVFVPPFNRFDARQYPLLAARFDVVCSGPETIGSMGFHSTPQARGGAIHLPSYAPLYGRAREVAPALAALRDAGRAVWAPVTLHWGWEADEDWRALEELAPLLAELAVPWEELIALSPTRLG